MQQRRSTPVASPRRDALFLLLGTLLGIPAGLFTNYIYDALFPNSVSVSVDGTGVKELVVPIGYFAFTDYHNPVVRDGTINVVYGQGTDTSDFKCKFSVSNAAFLESYAFEPGCRRLKFRFKAREEIWKLAKATRQDTIVFSLSIASPSKGAWEGETSVSVWVDVPVTK